MVKLLTKLCVGQTILNLIKGAMVRSSKALEARQSITGRSLARRHADQSLSLTHPAEVGSSEELRSTPSICCTRFSRLLQTEEL